MSQREQVVPPKKSEDKQPPEELKDVEEGALGHLEEGALEHIEEEVVEVLGEEEEERAPLPAIRISAALVFPVLASAVMVGGIYKGILPRFWAALAGVVGIGLAYIVRRIRNPWLMNLAIIGGIGFGGILLAAFKGNFSNILNIGPFVNSAIASGDIVRPPVEWSLGWAALVGWMMTGLGLGAGWIAMELQRPALGMMLPVPVIMFAAISVPDDQKLLSGLLALAIFGIGLGVLSGIETEGDREQRSLRYEFRRAVKGLPLIALITGGLFILAQTNFLFPPPLYDPASEAQKPRYVPPPDVEDTVLFTAKSSIKGPWRMGGLDVYDGLDWRLPPFKDSKLEEVDESGIVDSELKAGVKADFQIVDLTGAVLPGLPNAQGIVASGPILAFDERIGNIRMAEGQIEPGLAYTVTAARLPTVEELRNVVAEPPKEVKKFLEIPDPPRTVQRLLDRAPDTSPWDKIDFLRNELLQTVTAEGQGRPVSVPPERVEAMLSGKTGSPYEIVAAQAMLARWAGIPARIGYGFDGGEQAGDTVEVRPRHGASWLEIYFRGYKWLPVIGNPLLAKSTLGSQQTQQNRDVLPSDDIATKVFIPFQTDPQQFLFEQIRYYLSIIVPIVALVLFTYFSFPFLVKAWRRTKRRTWAIEQGPTARAAVAYLEWRDLATDFGYRYNADTPLMFLDRVTPDDEHVELGWLLTRALWGDMQGMLNDDDASAAEEIARSLKKRMSQAHPWTLRWIAGVSRLSLRDPYSPLHPPTRAEIKGLTGPLDGPIPEGA